MKSKLIVLFLLCLVLTVVTTVKTRPIYQQQVPSTSQGSKPGTLQWVAEQAKAKGKQEVTVPTGAINEYGVAPNVDEALFNFSLVVATLVSKESYIEGSDDIKTWYKFRNIETLRQADKYNCSSCQGSLTPPTDMLPLADNEFLILKDGGTVVVDGVKITSYDPQFPDLSASSKYMLFISPDPAEKIQALGMGPYGIYAIKDNGALESIIKREDHPLSRDIKARLGDSIAQVRANLRSKIVP
jgi:hypothetical protein